MTTAHRAASSTERIACGTLHVFDTSDLRGGYVLDCDSGVQLRLSALAYRVVAAAWTGASFDEIAARCSDGNRRLSAHDAGALYERVVASVEVAQAQRARHAIGQGFLLRRTLIPASCVCRLAAPCAALFGPVAAVLATALIAGVAAYWFATQPLAPAAPSGYELAAGYALFVLSCLAHEIGHAAACLRFGVRPGPIGAALYLIFPVLYSDVTRIWRLNRWRRVAVDVGGSYVQCLLGVAYVLMYLQTHAAAFFIAISCIIASTLLNMNPLFRFDGYWIVSDALGVSGLMSHVKGLLGRAAARLAGRGNARVSPWPGHIAAFVTIYSVVALVAWAWFIVQLIAYAFGQARWLFTLISAHG